MKNGLIFCFIAALGISATNCVNWQNRAGSSNNDKDDSVAEKFRQLIGVECASFEECVNAIKADSFQLVFQKLSKYNVTVARDEISGIQTISLPAISLPPYNFSGNARFDQGAKMFAALSSIDVHALKKAGPIYTVNLDQMKIRSHGLTVDLMNPAVNQYDASVVAHSINVSFVLDVTAGQMEVLSAPFSIAMIRPSIKLETALSNEEGYLQVSSCTSNIDYSNFLISTKQPKLMALTGFLVQLMKSTDKSLLGTLFCTRYRPKLNQLLINLA